MKPSDYWALVLVFALLAVAPALAGPFYTRLLATGILYGTAAVGFNVLFGYTGLLSFGHAMFWGAGAYTVAIGMVKMGLSFPASLALSLLVVGVIALVTGFLSLRHTRIYFAMLTLAFGQLLYAIALKWRSMTGADEGIYGVPRPLGDVVLYYYLILGVSLVVLLALLKILKSPLGLAFRSIRDNPFRAEVVGYPVNRLRLLSYTISGLATGVAGSLYAPLQTSVNPESLYWTFSAAIVFMAILGGSRVFIGPFIGGLLYVFIQDTAMGATEYWLLATGITLGALILLLPEGIVGYIWRRLGGRLE
ncbi:MAG: branched-chain amino acid ABC transporter permease [Desulfurococcales archaeon]|nr:branched-chain amino acid ABC transporter permease [Desulfurococcales archaeon]